MTSSALNALTANPAEPGDGYKVVRFNAMKHGILSRYTVLSHENHADYESLVNSLMDEHLPAGATEQHLIEELASVIWRKRRVLQSEGATINKGLKESARNAKTIIPTAAPFEMGLSGEHTDLRDVMSLSDEEAPPASAMPTRCASLQPSRQIAAHRWGQGVYQSGARTASRISRHVGRQRGRWRKHPQCRRAVSLHPAAPGRQWPIRWKKRPATTRPSSTRHWAKGCKRGKLEKLSRYETHLDRKFERTLGMLVKLKELRLSRATGQFGGC
jgi:hypothetical protein